MSNRISSASTVIGNNNNSEAYQISNNNNNNNNNEFNVTSSPSLLNYNVNSYSSASMQPVETAYVDDSANNYSLSNENSSSSYKPQIDILTQRDSLKDVTQVDVPENPTYYNDPSTATTYNDIQQPGNEF